MPILKQCSSRGCYKIVDEGEVYCKYHQEKCIERQRESYKEWRKKRVTTEEQKELDDFYKSIEWQNSRDAAVKYHYGMDIFEFYRTGKIVEGEIVHHIIEARENKELRYTVENLIYLTALNHKRIHKRYNKSSKDKKRIQDMLFALKLKFDNEFK